MKKILVLLMVTLLVVTGCKAFEDTPTKVVNRFLNNYKNNDEAVINELNDYLATQDLDEETLEDYREIYLRQYSNMDFVIKNEKIDGDKADVDVQITVYDYYKTNMASGDYFTANQADFVDDNGDVDISKYLAYKIKKMLDTTDTVDYTLTINLNKINDKWEIEPLTTEQLSKLHGTYEY